MDTTGLNILLAITANSILQRANPVIGDFFTSPVIIFVLVAVYANKINGDNNILVALATAFFAVILVQFLLIQDFRNLLEPFNLIYPGPSSSKNCLKVTRSDLVNSFGDENKLKGAMMESGVPLNMALTDVNAPEIATYLVNNKSSGFTGCLLVE